MSDLDLLRSSAPPTEAPSGEAHLLALRRLDERMARHRSSRLGLHRRSGLAAAAALAIAAASVALAVLGIGLGGRGEQAAAASLLRAAAAAVRGQTPLVPARGQYLYVKTEDAYLGTDTDAPDWSVLVPHVRETWLGLDYSRIYATSGKPVFLSERDRARWIEHGRPPLPASDHPSEMRARPRVSNLPSDADDVYRKLADEATGKSAGFAWLMFQLIGDALRETISTPEQRAALYDAAARVPGIRLVGDVSDRLGRPCVAVAVLNEDRTERLELLLDPHTFELRGEEETVLDGNAFGYPAGTVIGYATYLTGRLVGSDHERP